MLAVGSIRWRRWLVIFLMSVISVAGATEQIVLRLSLDEAEQLWQTHNHEIKLSKTAVRAAEADLVTAGQAPNPQLSLNVASISPNEGFGAGGLRDKKMDSILRLEQLIERGGKRELRAQSAAAKQEASQHDLDDTRRQQGLALSSAYFDLLLAQEKKYGAEESATLYASSLAAGERRLQAGDLSLNELSRLRIEKLRAENEARQSFADYATAQGALAYLIGMEEQASRLAAADHWPAVDSIEKSKALETADLARRPDILAAQARVVAAEAGRDLARSLKKRDVTVGAQL